MNLNELARDLRAIARRTDMTSDEAAAISAAALLVELEDTRRSKITGRPRKFATDADRIAFHNGKRKRK